MKKKVICICLIVFSIASTVVYPEVPKWKERKEKRDQLEKKMKRLGIQYYPDEEVGDVLKEKVYFYANFLYMEIEGEEFRGPILVVCETTDCFSRFSHNTDVPTMESWEFDPDDDESQIKAFFDAIDAIKLDYPWIYGVRIIYLTYYGQISNKQLWPLKRFGPFDENF